MLGKIKQSIECWLFAEELNVNATVLLLQAGPNQKHPAYWQPVTGGMEPGETAEDACRREVREETGICLEPSRLLRLPQTFDVPIDQALIVHKTLFLATTDTRQVQISDEHVGWQWVPFRSAEALLYWPSSHKTYAATAEQIRLR